MNAQHCKSCKKTDHTRRTSQKCLNYLPPIRKRKLSASQAGLDVQLYVVKRGLVSALCPLMDPEKRFGLVAEIRRDVRDLSGLYVELGIFINYYHKRVRETDHTWPEKPNILHFTYALKNKSKKTLLSESPIVQEYLQLRRAAGALPFYDAKLRTFVIQEQAHQYETCLQTNVETHAFSRLKRYFRDYHQIQDTALVHEQTYLGFYTLDFDSIREPVIRDTCRLINCKSSWWRALPKWIDIQHELASRALKSFSLFPQPSHRHKSLTYTSRGWHELLLRVDKDGGVSSVWPKIQDHRAELWAPWFDNLKSNFGCCIQTDGCSVSLSMNRYVPKTTTAKKSKYEKTTPKWAYNTTPLSRKFDRIIAVDPGSRYPIVTCDDTFSCRRISRKYVYRNSLEWKREAFYTRTTASAETAERIDRERLQAVHEFPLSVKNHHIVEYTTFRLKWFAARQRVYDEHPKLTRLKLDKYIRQMKLHETIVRDVFGAKEKDHHVLVMYGAGCEFMNTANFSGRKFKHDALLRRLRAQRNTSVEIVDEAYTSQACSECNRRERKFVKIALNARLRWGFCQKCHSEFDRDINAARNILINNTVGRTVVPTVPTT